MKKTKEFLAIGTSCFLAMCFVLSIVGNADAKKWQLRSADVNPMGDPYTIAMNKFCELLEQRSNGEITMKHFPAGMLGKDQAIIEGIKLGTIDIGMVGQVASKVQEAFYLPFLFKDADHMERTLNGPIGEKLKRAFEEETGLKLIAFTYFGPRQLTTKNKKVVVPADCKGLKIRVPQAPTMVATWKALGASPTPISWTETFTALQQGVVDGQENPFQVILDSSLYEVQKYLMTTYHATPVRFIIINADLWKDIGPNYQKLMTDIGKEAAMIIKKIYLENDASYQVKLKAKGMIFVEPDIEAFRKATESVWKEFAPAAWGPGTWEEIQKLRN
jgi:tripartite ATP-independent transporter DctP family solute receptor